MTKNYDMEELRKLVPGDTVLLSTHGPEGSQPAGPFSVFELIEQELCGSFNEMRTLTFIGGGRCTSATYSDNREEQHLGVDEKGRPVSIAYRYNLGDNPGAVTLDTEITVSQKIQMLQRMVPWTENALSRTMRQTGTHSDLTALLATQRCALKALLALQELQVIKAGV